MSYGCEERRFQSLVERDETIKVARTIDMRVGYVF